MYTINESSYTLIILINKKLLLYTWQEQEFIYTKTMKDLTQPAKILLSIHDYILLGYRKNYEFIHIPSNSVIKSTEHAEKDHALYTLEVYLLSCVYII